MCPVPQHIDWLKDTGKRISTKDGKKVELWEFIYQKQDEILTEWARHFRNHYCSDNEIDTLRAGTGYSRSEYLTEIKFPDRKSRLGPMIRSGDFGEILIADFLQFIQGFWVPRSRYDDKVVRDESKKGCDVIGFKILKDDENSPDDLLIIFESKTQFSGRRPQSKLQESVDHSRKDQFRKAFSLNAFKQRFIGKDEKAALRIQRFQNPLDNPYKEKSGAAALFSNKQFDPKLIQETNTSHHPNHSNLVLIVIKGNSMMNLVHELYRRAADEA
jgi:hypothetical protein